MNTAELLSLSTVGNVKKLANDVVLLVPDNLQNTSAVLEDITSKVDVATVESKTGTAIQSVIADDSIVEVTKIEGSTLITKPNASADISPDNVATITNAKNFDVVVTGKNILPMFNNQTSNGITITVANDGTVTLNGTASATTFINVPFTNKLLGAYTMSANNPIVNAEVNLRLSSNAMGTAFSAMNTVCNVANATASFAGIDGTPAFLTIRVGTGQVLTNFTMKPQLEVGSTATAYVSYQGVNKITITQELPKLPNGVCDTIEKKSDGKWYYIQRVGKTVIDGSADEVWWAVLVDPSTYYLDGNIPNANIYVAANVAPNLLSDKLKTYSFTGLTADIKPAFGLSNRGNNLYHNVAIRNSLIVNDVAAFKTWLVANPVTLYYELAAPVETIINPCTLTSYKGTTCVSTTSNPQVAITAVFKSRLANSYSVQMAEIAKIKQAIVALGGTV